MNTHPGLSPLEDALVAMDRASRHAILTAAADKRDEAWHEGHPAMAEFWHQLAAVAADARDRVEQADRAMNQAIADALGTVTRESDQAEQQDGTPPDL